MTSDKDFDNGAENRPANGPANGQPHAEDALVLGPMPADDDPTAIILRRALANAATSVEPSQNALQAIQARTGEIRRITETQLGRMTPVPAVTPPEATDVSAPDPLPGPLPGPAGISGATAAGSGPSTWRRRWAPLAAAAAVITVGLLGGGLLGRSLRDDPATTAVGTDASVAAPGTDASSLGPQPSTNRTPSASAAASASATEPAPATQGPQPSPSSGTKAARTVPVYWFSASRTRLWLYREFQASVTGVASVEAAVRTLLQGRPVDQDYDSLWRSASTLEVTTAGDQITIDLSQDAFRAGEQALRVRTPSTVSESDLAEASVQQLVWTATAAYGKGDAVAVTILVDGATGYEAWGHVELGAPMQRDPQARAPIWLINPQDGASLAGAEVTITGSGYAFEGTISWEITRGGAVVDSGVVTTRGDGVPGDFSITARLEPGRYEVTAYQADASDGESPEGPRQFADTKSFEVR